LSERVQAALGKRQVDASSSFGVGLARILPFLEDNDLLATLGEHQAD
jgi:hypothetical protein